MEHALVVKVQVVSVDSLIKLYPLNLTNSTTKYTDSQEAENSGKIILTVLH